MKEAYKSTAQSKAIQDHRRRLKARGLVRLDVQTTETDTVLIRRLAKVLREDPEQAAVLRRQLNATLGLDRNRDGRVTREEWLKACPCLDVRGEYG